MCFMLLADLLPFCTVWGLMAASKIGFVLLADLLPICTVCGLMAASKIGFM